MILTQAALGATGTAEPIIPFVDCDQCMLLDGANWVENVHRSLIAQGIPLFVLLLILLGNVWTGLYLVGGILVVEIEMIGYLTLTGLTYNPYTMLYLIIAPAFVGKHSKPTDRAPRLLSSFCRLMVVWGNKL
jgi:uncharacterized membrane protein